MEANDYKMVLNDLFQRHLPYIRTKTRFTTRSSTSVLHLCSGQTRSDPGWSSDTGTTPLYSPMECGFSSVVAGRCYSMV